MLIYRKGCRFNLNSQCWLSSLSGLTDYCQEVIFNRLMFLYFGNVRYRIREDLFGADLGG